MRGLAAVYRFYYSLGETRCGYAGADGWRYALLAHRYGQNSKRAKELDCDTDRIRDAESMMRRNGLWCSEDDEKGEEPMPDAEKTAKNAAKWALSKVGCRYSQAERTKKDVFDCSSLVARAYGAQGVSWELVGSEVPNSTQEVYSDQFLLLWPESYEEIGVELGGRDVLKRPRGRGPAVPLHGQRHEQSQPHHARGDGGGRGRDRPRALDQVRRAHRRPRPLRGEDAARCCALTPPRRFGGGCAACACGRCSRS